MGKLAAAALGLVGLFMGAACSGSGRSPSVTPPPYTASPPAEPESADSSSSTASRDNSAAIPDSSDLPAWLSVDSVGRTVTLSLETSAPEGGSSAVINGYRSGTARVIVPVGWTIKWSWRNADASSPHSLIVMTQREKIPPEGGRSAFSNAMTRTPTEGLGSGETDQTSFQAEEAGWYWLLCGVPNHALTGEWIELRIDPDAKTAGFTEKARS
jgi:Sulfocyanin (SoxE) domain